MDLFRRLSSGAKYDRRRLSRELAVFQVTERLEDTYSTLVLAIDHKQRVYRAVFLCYFGFFPLTSQGRRVEEKGDEKSIAAALDFFGDSSAQEEEGLPPDIARKGSDSKPTLGKREHGHHGER